MTTEEEKLQAAAAQLKKELMPFVGKPNTKKVRRQIVDHLLNTLVTDGLLSSTEAPTLTPTLTVGQIIKRLGPLAPNAATAKERIKYWTQHQLLTPINQHHAGTGRHRRYASHTVYEAAVLTALMDAGLHVISRPYIKHALQLALQWRFFHSRFLVIAHQVGREPVVSVSRGGEIIHGAESVVMISLSQLFSKLHLDK